MMNRTIVLLLTLISSKQLYAFSWHDLWKTNDQQAFEKFINNEYEKAAAQFENRLWKGSSYYRSGDYEKAYDTFSADNSAKGYYNRGNALAFANKIQEAIAHYDEALRLNPDFDDAKFNREILKKLLEDNQANNSEETQAEQNKKDENETSSDADQNQDSQQSENQSSQNQNQSESDKQQDSSQKVASQEAGSSEQEQSTDQWLKQIPDDPGGLLKQKFLRDYIKRKHIEG